MKDYKADLMAIAVTVICIFIVLAMTKAHAAPFTVDERSAIHFGASAGSAPLAT